MTNEARIEQHVDYARILAEKFCQRRGIEDGDVIDDYAGEALLELVKEGRKFKDKKGMKFRTFIHQRLTWALLRYHKAQDPDYMFITGAQAMDDEDDDESIVNAVDMHSDGWFEPYRMACAMERDDVLEDLVGRLTPRERQTVYALYYEDKTLDEAAEDGAGSRMAISRFKHSALTKLRARWRK